YDTVAEYIPVSFDPNVLSITAIEEKSGLEGNAISDVRALKPPECCCEGQHFAHFSLSFSNRDQANWAIRHGLVIAGKQVQVRHRLAEPKHCLCCQHVGGHLSGACKASEPVCARCAEHHNTSACSHAGTQELTQLHCTNCSGKEAEGHGAASHSCPTFLKKLQTMFAYSSANKYRFFPTDDPSTW
ncbi:hypothetical protein BDQ17DRAFT_1176758, partial [Cyathus striatus]